MPANAEGVKTFNDYLNLAGQGLAGVILVMAGAIAGCSIAQGLPLVVTQMNYQLEEQPMTRFWPVLLLLAILAWTGPARSVVPDRPNAGAVFEKDIHAEAQAWQFSGVDLPKGAIASLSAKGSWKTNPLWRQSFGAGGNPKTKAGTFYLRAGAKEGCLLVRIGNTVLPFFKDEDVVVVDTPGKIYCCANDEPTEDGTARFKDLLEGKHAKGYRDALPIQALKRGNGGSGFLDNVGIITVRVAVKKAE
jgi:hypothetical protein